MSHSVASDLCLHRLHMCHKLFRTEHFFSNLMLLSISFHLFVGHKGTTNVIPIKFKNIFIDHVD